MGQRVYIDKRIIAIGEQIEAICRDSSVTPKPLARWVENYYRTIRADGNQRRGVTIALLVRWMAEEKGSPHLIKDEETAIYFTKRLSEWHRTRNLEDGQRVPHKVDFVLAVAMAKSGLFQDEKGDFIKSPDEMINYLLGD